MVRQLLAKMFLPNLEKVRQSFCLIYSADFWRFGACWRSLWRDTKICNILFGQCGEWSISYILMPVQVILTHRLHIISTYLRISQEPLGVRLPKWNATLLLRCMVSALRLDLLEVRLAVHHHRCNSSWLEWISPLHPTKGCSKIGKQRCPWTYFITRGIAKNYYHDGRIRVRTLAAINDEQMYTKLVQKL